MLAGEAAAALAGHDALWAWDLGNENSNCVIPPNRASATRWLEQIDRGDPSRGRRGARHGRPAHGGPGGGPRLGPREAAAVVRLPLDARLPDLRRLGRGRDRRAAAAVPRRRDPLARGRARRAVLRVRPADLPRRATRPARQPVERVGPHWSTRTPPPRYTTSVSTALRRRRLSPARCSGATPTTTPAHLGRPPLDLAMHERSFGLWRADGSPKPAVAAVAAFAGMERRRRRRRRPWIDIEPNEFFVDPGTQLPRLYRRYRHVSTKSDSGTAERKY